MLLFGRGDLRGLVEAGASLGDMESSWRRDLAAFDATRSRFYLYPD